MKTFLFIFIFALSLKAESSYQYKCISDWWLQHRGTQLPTLNIIYSGTTSIYSTTSYDNNIITQLVNNDNKFKFVSTTQRCNLIPKNNTLGLTNEEYNFMMALTGLLSSILLVSIIFKKV